jgi:pimeloyl-ACP methyl ester carboxylesterase
MSLTTTSRYSDPTLPLWREAFAGLDWLSLRFSPVFAGHGVERGHGEAVVLVPGLFAPDASMIELSGWLARMGYRPYASGIGVNAVRTEAAIARVVATIDRAYAETGMPVRLIGHSLGGVIARAAALQRPDCVSHVITLGSPVNGLSAHPGVLAAARIVHGDDIDACLKMVQQSLPATIAETNIYSKSDGVVYWHTCHRDDATAIEVFGSHTGLIVNAYAYRAIAGTLAAHAAREARPATNRRVPVEARGGMPSSTTKISNIAA